MEFVTKARTWNRTLLLYATEQADIEHTLTAPERCKLFFVLDGSGTLYLDEQSISFGAGSLLFFSHQAEACIQWDSSAVHQCLGLYFHPTTINDNLTYDFIETGLPESMHGSSLYHDYILTNPFYGFEQSYQPIITPSTDAFNQLVKRFFLIHDELHLQMDDYWPCRSRSYLIELLFSLQSLFTKKNMVTLDNPFELAPDEELSPVALMIAYMETHLAEKITLNDLERVSALNRNQINLNFRTETNCTCMQYLTNLRMDFARSLLRNTELPQKEIALRCGFQDYGHFCKTFKRVSQTTPQDYRKSSIYFSCE